MSNTATGFLQGLSSLSRYYNKPLPGFLFKLIEGSIVDIAKSHDNIRYPGVSDIDAVVFSDDKEILFTCADSIEKMPKNPLSVMNLLFDTARGVFIDRAGCYKDLRSLTLRQTESSEAVVSGNLLEAAALVSCFGFRPSRGLLDAFGRLNFDSAAAEPAPLIQRLYLSAVVAGDDPAAGLKLLRDYGAVEALWPELHALIGLDQAKEFHPEGDVWEHSIETLSHRKTDDLELSIALLLHDLGKPLSVQVNGNRFNNHAQIGGSAARSFLRRLEFSEKSMGKICFLVENHMMPAAIKTLPLFRSEKAMLNPYFPLLLEVYRCDLESTFMGPDGYYEACKVYRSFIKNTKNPFRNSDGKKLMRIYVN